MGAYEVDTGPGLKLTEGSHGAGSDSEMTVPEAALGSPSGPMTHSASIECLRSAAAVFTWAPCCSNQFDTKSLI
jgi:hypothetical protein